MFEKWAALFFENPWHHRRPPGQFGILYLLRRDINSCLGAEASMANRAPRQIHWPGAMGVFAGIDLLAKFLVGDDKGKVAVRFRAFVSRYFHLHDGDLDAVYQLRNSMLHSFGLYSRDNKGNDFRFRLVSSGSRPLVRHTPPGHYLVDVLSLHEDFERAVAEYEQDVRTDPALQQNFVAIFPNYGAIPIG